MVILGEEGVSTSPIGVGTGRRRGRRLLLLGDAAQQIISPPPIRSEQYVIEFYQIAYRNMRSIALWNGPVITPAPRSVWFPYSEKIFDQL